MGVTHTSYYFHISFLKLSVHMGANVSELYDLEGEVAKSSVLYKSAIDE